MMLVLTLLSRDRAQDAVSVAWCPIRAETTLRTHGREETLIPELLVDFITSLDGYGANTYRLMAGLAAEGEPGTDALAGLNKLVFSTTLTEPLAWPNTQLVARDAVAAVREMKSEGSRPLRTIGSLTLCRSLLKAELVDRFRVVVFPVITGSTGQDRIYDGYPDVALEMFSSRTFDGRSQLLEYVPTVLAGPPAAAEANAGAL
jgi:dihydrofolate reductase